MPLQLDNLCLSPRHGFTPNADVNTRNWPQIFFWTEGLMLLNWTHGLMKHISELDKNTKEKFWQGSITPTIRKLDSDLFAKWPPPRIVEYCRVQQSKEKAWTRLIVKACGDRENPKNADLGFSLGDIHLDAKNFVIRKAAKFKTTNHGGIPEFISKAARQNDVRFFIRLGRALQSRKSPADVDWKRVDPIACFLVQNWCEGLDYNPRLPALCFFSNQALADFCSAAFGRKDGNPSTEAIRQWRKRLGLKQVSNPKVEETIVIGNKVLFKQGK